MQKGFIFDLDGTIYLDKELIDGANDTINQLNASGHKVVFFTNKSIETVESYVKKLNGFGIEASRENVINSNILTAKFLRENVKEDEKVLVIGESPLFDELEEYDIQTSDNPLAVKYVVLGWDRTFTYDKINLAYQAWLNGAKIIATNPDRTCPLEDGQVPDCGAMIGALEGATGEPITTILGKPSVDAAKYIVESVLQLPKDQCYMVGDRIETDIKMGNDYGINTILVLTGITNKQLAAQSSIKPTYTFDSVNDIVAL